MVEMSNYVVDVTRLGLFEREVLKSEQPAALLVWSPGCLYCRSFMSIYNQTAEKYRGKITFAILNIDKNPLTLEDYKIVFVPHTMLFYHGNVVGSREGRMTEPVFEQFLNDAYKELFNEELFTEEPHPCSDINS